MKQIKIKKSYPYLIVVCMVLGSFSCKKSLDSSLNVIPGNSLTNASVWSSSSTADVFLNSIYGYLPDGNNEYDPFDNWSDNSICGFAWPV